MVKSDRTTGAIQCVNALFREVDAASDSVQTYIMIYRNPFNRFLTCFVLGVLVNFTSGAQVLDQQGIQPWSKNPWYWSYHGEPLLLLGGTDDDSLFQWTEDRLIPQLDRLAASGGNVIRNTMSDRKDKGFEIYPFRQLPNGKYDLKQWNSEYWERFARMLRETSEREIIVQIEIWDRFDFTDNRGANRWQIHPYNPKNNINYTYAQSGFADRYPDHPGQNNQPFFYTTPDQRNNRMILRFQERFLDKLLDHALKFDHVLYCIDNETKAEESWPRYWAEFVKKRAVREGRTIYVTEMWDDWDLHADRHKRTFDHPELYDFVDVSQNNHNSGQKHWDNFLHVRKYLTKQPRPMNTTKIYGASGNKFGHTDQDGIERFWRHVLAGGASVRFHRPDSGHGLNDKAVACIRAARKLESIIPLWSVSPANQLLSERDANEAYLAALTDEAYVLYFPQGGTVRLNLAEKENLFELRWIDVKTGEWGETESVATEGSIEISSPGEGNWVAALTRRR